MTIEPKPKQDTLRFKPQPNGYGPLASARPLVVLNLLERGTATYTTVMVAQALQMSVNTVGPLLSAAKAAGLVERIGFQNRRHVMQNTPRFLSMSPEAADRLIGDYDGTSPDSLLRVHLRNARHAIVRAIDRHAGATFTTQAIGAAIGWKPTRVAVYLRPIVAAGLVAIEKLGVYRRTPTWSIDAAVATYKKRRRTLPPMTRPRATSTPEARPIVAATPPATPALVDLDQLTEWRRKAEAYDRLVARLRAAGIEPGQ